MVSSSRSWNSADMSGCRRPGASSALSGTPLEDDGERYTWSSILAMRLAPPRWPTRVRCASSRSTMRRRRSPTPRSQHAGGFQPASGHEPGQRECRGRGGWRCGSTTLTPLVAVYSDRFEYDDRRPLSGDPIESGSAVSDRPSSASSSSTRTRITATLAVRGERLELAPGAAGRTTPGTRRHTCTSSGFRRRRADHL